MQGLPYGVSSLVPCIYSLLRLCFSAVSKKSLRGLSWFGLPLVLFPSVLRKGAMKMKIAELEEIIEDLEKKKDEIYILNIFI